MTDNSPQAPTLQLEPPPWAELTNEIWLGSTLQLHRNVEKYLFPGRLESAKRAQLLKIMEQMFLQQPQFKEPRFLRAEELSPIDKQRLAEHFFVTSDLQQAHIGEGFLIDQTGRFLAICNMRDHLVLLQEDWHGELEESWNALADLEVELGNKLTFAFSTRFGFLTADPFQCGTGLVVECYLHLPALIRSNKLQEALAPYEEISCSSLMGEGEGFVGDLVVLRNSATLGTTEESIVASLRQVTSHLTTSEKAARSELAEKNDVTMRDKVGRAFGLLANSLQLQAPETLDQLSLIKLGVHLNWITGITPALCNQLFFLTRRGHLAAYLNRGLEHDEVPQQRAALLRELLRPAHFTT
jgi:protein arginine kinase